MPTIRLQNISKYYVDKKDKSATAVLYNVNGEIAEGTFAVVMGSSGCGKTTLLKCIAGLLTADEGQILFDGQDVTTLPAGKRNVSYMSQEYALYPHMTVFDNVAYPLKLANVNEEEIRRRADETLLMLNLGMLSSRRPRQLSGGQQQRVALARAIVKRPSVLLLDEPLSNVDDTLKEPLMEELVSLQQKLGITFVYVTHNLAEAKKIAQDILVMENGEIVESGNAEKLLKDKQSFVYRNFVVNTPPKHFAPTNGDTDEIV